MPVTLHPVSPDLTPAEIDRWGGIPVAVAVDLVIGDDDGLVALSPQVVRTRIGDAEARLAREAGWIRGLAEGRSAAEVFGLAPLLRG